MSDRQEQRLESVHLRALLQERDRLLAVRRVVIDERDLFALELVEPAFLLGDVLQENVGCGPVGAEQGEVPLEYRAVARLGAAVAHGDDRDLVDRRLLREGEGDAGRQRDHVGGAGRTFALQPLVALDPAIGGIAGVAFLEYNFDAVDAAVALVDEPVVVGKAVGERDAVRRVGASAVDQSRDELLILRQRRRGRRRGAEQRTEHDRDRVASVVHRLSSIELPGGRCRTGRSSGFAPASGRKCARDLPPAQYGNGHSRSFSLPIAHSRARPCGSTIRKNTMMTPNSMNSICDIVAVEIGIPSHDGSWLSVIGSSTMKAAPRNEPRIVPSPPMMIMNSTWNDRLTSNASGSQEPSRRNPHSAPATPI